MNYLSSDPSSTCVLHKLFCSRLPLWRKHIVSISHSGVVKLNDIIHCKALRLAHGELSRSISYYICCYYSIVLHFFLFSSSFSVILCFFG